MGRLQTARLENFVRRWGSIKGGGSVLSESLGDVFPVLDLENLTPENQLPAGWSLTQRFITVVGIAAQLTGVSVINPADSGAIVVVDKILVQSNTSQNFTYGVDLPLFTVVTTFQNQDTRSSNQQNGSMVMGGNANVGAAFGGGFFRALANVTFILEAPNGLAVLAPGGQFGVAGATVQTNITMSAFGRVRLAEPSELSF